MAQVQMTSREGTAIQVQPSKESKVGVCVLNWNSGDTLLRCLESLLIAVADIDHDIVVVDNASSDGSARLSPALDCIPVLAQRSNRGYAVGNNLGATYLLGRGASHILFVNPDARPFPGSIRLLMDALSEFDRVGCSGSASIDETGALVPGCRTRPTWLEKIVLYGPLRRMRWSKTLAARHYETSGDKHVYAVSGACIMFRGDAFLEIGGFDEATFLYEEEFIVAERLRRCGWSVSYLRAPLYAHIGGLTTGQIPLLRRLYFIRSEQHLVNEYWQWSWAAARTLFLYRCLEFGASAVSHEWRALVRALRSAALARG
jgi:GT2 family glycosyltransferase